MTCLVRTVFEVTTCCDETVDDSCSWDEPLCTGFTSATLDIVEDLRELRLGFGAVGGSEALSGFKTTGWEDTLDDRGGGGGGGGGGGRPGAASVGVFCIIQILRLCFKEGGDVEDV